MLSRRDPPSSDGRAVSKVIGTVLMVAIVVLLSVAALSLTWGMEEKMGGPFAETAMDFDQHRSGLLVTPDHIGQEVTVTINGAEILRYDGDDAGESRLLPVAPGDTVMVRAANEERSILLRKVVDPSEAGKFVAFYSFEEKPSGGTVPDRSWQSNDGSLETYGGSDGPEWVSDDGGTGLEFDGDDDYVHVPNLDTAEEVTEFTVAVRFRFDGPTSGVQQLVEHHHSGNHFEWYLESDSGNLDVVGKIGTDGDSTEPVITGPRAGPGDVHVAVMTFDGDEQRYYQDGSLVGTETRDETIKMGELNIGADAPSANRQFLDGTIYELRLYHTAFSDENAKLLSKVMSSEVAER